ncbi:MAG TPA: hypothetical protein VGN99_09230 [Steroidobacteraceae bacterium]|jgi:ElaB/YqjD/DUF883 family membrane-anchored ribosome-binding protein|nr:hypothetical protein [Steroidobacteraceae bacterium]
MNMATLLKNTANLLMGLSLVKLLAGDLGAEIRHDAAAVGERTQALVQRSRYRAIGSAAALGLLAGIFLDRRRHRPHDNR